MSTFSHILEMLKLQDTMNAVVNPQWREANYAWHRAIYVEGAELLDHLGSWKWWKKGTPDVVQAQIELVDIWHFGMSSIMNSASAIHSVTDLAGAIYLRLEEALKQARASAPVPTEAEINQSVDNLVAAGASGRFDLDSFAQLMHALDLDIDKLYTFYIGKNALNRFRQSHGYKKGTYIKVWRGEEDNVHLERIVAERPADIDSLFDWVYEQLEQAYPLEQVYPGSAA